MNYKILFSNLILLVLIILVIIYLFKDKIKESFFNPSNNCAPEDSEIIYNEDGDPIPVPPVRPADYNPNDYYMCRNVGWKNTDVPYRTKKEQNWYDAEKQCQKDFRCQSFSFNGDMSNTKSDVDYYQSINASEISSNWGTTKPSLYVKTREPCITTTPVTIYNQESSGNLQSSTLDIPYKYENRFIRETQKYMNDYNDKQFYNL